MFVDELRHEQDDERKRPPAIIKSQKEEKNPNYPENYRTCINFFRLFRKMAGVGMWNVRVFIYSYMYFNQFSSFLFLFLRVTYIIILQYSNITIHVNVTRISCLNLWSPPSPVVPREKKKTPDAEEGSKDHHRSKEGSSNAGK